MFFSPAGDHYRTRLTHTLEVAQIARTIAKVLRLHEELTEAIALGHDLGHTPFGHAGERVLSELVPGGFNHYEQSLRIVDVLENNRQGLNLTWEVRDGIARHSKGQARHAGGRAARTSRQHHRRPGGARRRHRRLRESRHRRCGARRDPERIDAAEDSRSSCSGTRRRSASAGWSPTSCTRRIAGGLTEIRMSEPVLNALVELRSYLFDAVYENQVATAEFGKAAGILGGLWEKVRQRPEDFLDLRTVEAEGVDVAAQDFLAGMTDRYAVRLFEELFIPKPWVETGAADWTDRLR